MKKFYKMVAVIDGTQELFNNLPLCDILVICYKPYMKDFKFDNLPITLKDIFVSHGICDNLFCVECNEYAEEIKSQFKLPFDCKINSLSDFYSEKIKHIPLDVYLENKDNICIFENSMEYERRNLKNSYFAEVIEDKFIKFVKKKEVMTTITSNDPTLIQYKNGKTTKFV